MALLNMTQVRERLPVSRPTIYALIEKQGFPKPEKVPGRGNLLFWPEAAVQAWLSKRAGGEG